MGCCAAACHQPVQYSCVCSVCVQQVAHLQTAPADPCPQQQLPPLACPVATHTTTQGEAHRQTNRQAGRHTDSQAGMQADKRQSTWLSAHTRPMPQCWHGVGGTARQTVSRLEKCVKQWGSERMPNLSTHSSASRLSCTGLSCCGCSPQPVRAHTALGCTCPWTSPPQHEHLSL